MSMVMTQRLLETRVKGLLQAHRLNVVNLQEPHPNRKITGMHTFIATYYNVDGVKQVRHFCIPSTFDRIYWLDDEVSVEKLVPARLRAAWEPKSSKEQIIDELSAENAKLRQRIKTLEQLSNSN